MSLRKKLERDEKKERIKKELYENKICEAVGRQLVHHYPSWKWYVDCRLDSGLISVRNLSLDGDYGFYIGIGDFLNETTPKLVMRAGGEILERFNQHRGERKKDVAIERDFKGSAIGDFDATS